MISRTDFDNCKMDMYGHYNQPKHVKNQTKPFNDSHISLALKLPLWFCFLSLIPSKTRHTTAQAWYPLLPFSFLLLLLLLTTTTTTPSFLPISTKLQCTNQTASKIFPACHPFHRMLDQSTGFFLSFSYFTVSQHFSGLMFFIASYYDSGGSSLASVAPLEAILFDIDGTLCDSDPLHFCAFRDMLQEVSHFPSFDL